MNRTLTRRLVILGTCLGLWTLFWPLVQGQEELAEVPAYAVRRVYLGEFRGHREEVDTLRTLLANALLEKGFAVVETPDEADYRLQAEMGFEDVWGEYSKSRNYRVYSTLHVMNPQGDTLWKQSFTKKPKCSRKCFRKIAETTAAEFREKAGVSAPVRTPSSNPGEIAPLSPLEDR